MPFNYDLKTDLMKLLVKVSRCPKQCSHRFCKREGPLPDDDGQSQVERVPHLRSVCRPDPGETTISWTDKRQDVLRHDPCPRARRSLRHLHARTTARGRGSLPLPIREWVLIRPSTVWIRQTSHLSSTLQPRSTPPWINSSIILSNTLSHTSINTPAPCPATPNTPKSTPGTIVREKDVLCIRTIL